MTFLEGLRDDCLACLRFFSRLPLPSTATTSSALPVVMLPLAGLLIGLGPAAILAASLILGLPPSLGGFLAIAALGAVSGAMHEDGLADCADGFGGGWERARKLEIMRDSRIGTYGVCALVLSLSIRALAVGSLATQLPVAAVAALAVVAALSRTACLMPLMLLPPARADGLGATTSRPSRKAFATATAQCAVASLILLLFGIGLLKILVMIGLGFGAAFLVCRIADRQIGGQTGDVAGAAQQAAEIAALLVLATT